MLQLVTGRIAQTMFLSSFAAKAMKDLIESQIIATDINSKDQSEFF